MEAGKVKVSKLKQNPSNPRVIKDASFEKLKNSIQSFPEMMEKRPMVCVTDVDSKLYPLGGNMRLKAIKDLGFKEVPASWIMLADDWTEDQRKEFVIKDNASFGDWDWETLQADWDLEQLEDWGVDVPITPDQLEKASAKEIDSSIDQYDDQNCELPIVPEFHEKYSYFIVLTTNEIDEAFVRNVFGLDIKHTSHKSTDDRLSNIIPFEKLQEICLK